MDFLNAARKSAEGTGSASPTQQRPSPKGNGSRDVSAQKVQKASENNEHALANGEANSQDAISTTIKIEVLLPEPTQTANKQDDEDVQLQEEVDEEEEANAESSSNDKRVPAASILVRRNRINDLANYLLKKSEDKSFELVAGFRFYDKGKPITELDLNTLPLALRWVQSVIDLLKNQTPGNIPAGGGVSLSVSRAGDNIKVVRSQGKDKQEFFFRFEDFAIKLREQVKVWAKVAQSVDEQILHKADREKEKDLKDDLKRRHEKIREKLQLSAFQAAAKELKRLFANNQTAPALSAKYEKQREKKRQAKELLRQENNSMMQHLLAAVPKSFIEANISQLIPKQDEDESESNASAPEPQPAQQDSKARGGKKDDKQGQTQSTNKPQQPAAEAAAPKKGPAPAPAPAKARSGGVFLSVNPYDIGEVDMDSIMETPAPEKAPKTEKPKAKPQPQQQSQPQPSAKEDKPSQQAKKTEKGKDKPAPQQPKKAAPPPEPEKQEKPRQREKKSSNKQTTPQERKKEQLAAEKQKAKEVVSALNKNKTSRSNMMVLVAILSIIILIAAVFLYITNQQ